REEVEHRAVAVDDAYAVLDRRRDVEAAVDVAAKSVAAASTEFLDHPLARTVGKHALQSASLDDDDRVDVLVHDAVAVEETAGEQADGSVALIDEHAATVLVLRREVTGVGEVHVAVARDGEVVRAVEPVVGEIRNSAVGRRELQARGRGHEGRE